jgi:DNA-directed RNA polymerase specialized sigma24 family protein
MAEINNPEAYFGRMLRNSDKNEYRANDNFYNHISSVGDEYDIQQESAVQDGLQKPDANSIERQISEASAENWLLFMENERLHKALSTLPTADVEFLLELARFRFNQAIFAKSTRTTRQAVSKRFLRIRKKILEIMETGLSKT